MIMWPKDRVIYNRLENIIQMFESDGEWPQQRSLFMYQQANGQLNGVPSCTSLTSSGSNTQIPTNPLSISNLVQSSSNPLLTHHQLLLAEQRKLMMSPMLGDNYSVDEDDDNMSLHENDPDYYTKASSNNESSKYQKPKRGRPPKFDLQQLTSSIGISASQATAIPADPAHKIRNLLGNSPSTSGLGKSKYMDDLDSIDENAVLTKSNEANKSGFLEPGEIFRPKSSRSKTQQSSMADSENSDASSSSSSFSNGGVLAKSNPNQKRGRKSTTGKEQSSASLNIQPAMNPADLAALAALFLVPGQDPDERITVINMEDGTRLTGSKAPKRIDLPVWLLAHPNYLPDEQEIINMTLKNSTIAALQQQHYPSNENLSLKSKQKPGKQSKHELMSHSPQSEDHNEEQDYSPSRPPSRPASSNSSITQPSPSRSKANALNKQQLNDSTSSKPPEQSSQLILFNKVTKKRIHSEKIPPLKHLNSFLEKNEQICIDPSSNDLIRSKFGKSIPDTVKARMINKSNSNKPAPSPVSTPKSNGQNSSQQNAKKPNPTSSTSKSNTSQQSQMFNPFSPNSAAQLQGLTDLLGATGGMDLNNPLTSFMAALAGQAGATPGLPGFGQAPGFNPFLLPPFAPPGLTGPSAGSTPAFNELFKDLGNKIPGLDMGFDDLSSLLAQHAQLSQALAGGATPTPSIKATESTKQKEQASSSKNQNNSSQNAAKNKPKEPETPEPQKHKKPQPTSSSSQKPSGNKDSKESVSSSKTQQASTSSSKNSIESKLNQKDQNVKKTESTSSVQKSKPAESQSRQSSNKTELSKQSQQQQSQMDFATLAAAMSQMDPTNPANMAALASMMEQEKFLQEMMNFSQFGTAGFASNPFLFGAGAASPFTPPAAPAPLSKSSRGRSPSPAHDRDHSISPALSVASNLSSQHQQAQSNVPGSLDFNLFMNNLMNYQLLGGAGAPGANAFSPAHLPPPPPLLGGMSGDLSKLPVDLLTALSAAAATQPGGLGALDPSMFSALAQLNTLSNNVSNEEKDTRATKTSGISKSTKPGSSSVSSKAPVKTPSSSSSNSQQKQASKTPSSSSSQNQLNKKPRLGASNDLDDSYQGLDLSIKKSSSSKSKPSDLNDD